MFLRWNDLAGAIRSVAAGPARAAAIQFHAHVEWYDGHPRLDPKSEPVVFYLSA
jgi:hypothetical protein